MSLYNSWPGGITTGTDLFTSAVFDGTYIWLVPYAATGVVRVSPASGAMTLYNTWPSGFLPGTFNAFAGGVYDGQFIWLAPFGANGVVQIVPQTGAMALFNAWPSGLSRGLAAFFGVVFDGNNSWMVPNTANGLVRITQGTGVMSLYSAWPPSFTGLGLNAFAGGVFDGANIWLIPYNANGLVKVLPSTGAMTLYNNWPVGFTLALGSFNGGVFDGVYIWLMPDAANGVVRVAATTGLMTLFNSWPSGFTLVSKNFVGGVFDGADVWMVPYLASGVVKLNRRSGRMTLYNSWPSGFVRGLNGFAGGVFDGLNIWLVPRSANGLVKLNSTGSYVSFSLSSATVSSDRSGTPKSASIQVSQSLSILSSTPSRSVTMTTSKSALLTHSSATGSSSLSQSLSPSRANLRHRRTWTKSIDLLSSSSTAERSKSWTASVTAHNAARRKSATPTFTGLARRSTRTRSLAVAPSECPLGMSALKGAMINATLWVVPMNSSNGGGGIGVASGASAALNAGDQATLTFFFNLSNVVQAQTRTISVDFLNVTVSAGVGSIVRSSITIQGGGVLGVAAVLDSNSLRSFVTSTSSGFISWSLVANLHVSLSSAAVGSFPPCSALLITGAVFNCQLLGGPPPSEATPPAVAPGTLATTQAALVVSIASAGMAGPGSASELQSMAIVSLARCSTSSSGSSSSATATTAAISKGYSLVTPFALSDSARGGLAGNAVVVGGFFILQFGALLFLRFVWNRSPIHAASSVRFPGYLALVMAALHQSTLFCSIRLIGGDNDGAGDSVIGIVGLVVCLAAPAAICAASAKIPRTFVQYECAPSSRFAQNPLRIIIPVGTTLPATTRYMASSLITSFSVPSPACVLIPFVSSLMTNLIAVAPADASTWVCAGLTYLSGGVHVLLAGAVLLAATNRFPSGRVLGAIGLALVAVFHIQIASGFRGGVDATLAAQAGLTIFRSFVAVGLALVERQMHSDPDVSLKRELWRVGNGGISEAKSSADASPEDLEMVSGMGEPLLLDVAANINSGESIVLSGPTERTDALGDSVVSNSEEASRTFGNEESHAADQAGQLQATNTRPFSDDML